MADESDELRRLENVVKELSSKVAMLESRLNALEGRNVPPVVAAAMSAPPTQPGETRIGLTLINRIGAFTLAIGIIFFFKYAADNQWIGPAGRVFIGLLIGAALIAAGDWMSRRDQRVFSQGILGCGLASVYISLYASFEYYKLISPAFGFALIFGACLLAIALSLRYTNAFIAALGLGGGFLTVVLLRTPSSGGLFQLAYLLLMDSAATVIAIRQKWPILIPLNAAWAIFAGAYLMRSAGWFTTSMCVLAALHFAASRSSADLRLGKHFSYIVGHACVVLGGLRFVGAEMRSGGAATTLDSVLVALYGIALLTFGILQRHAVDRGIGLSLLGLVVAKLYLYDIWLLEYGFRIVAFVVLGILLLVASYVYSRWRTRTRAEA